MDPSSPPSESQWCLPERSQVHRRGDRLKRTVESAAGSQPPITGAKGQPSEGLWRGMKELTSPLHPFGTSPSPTAHEPA